MWDHESKTHYLDGRGILRRCADFDYSFAGPDASGMLDPEPEVTAAWDETQDEGRLAGGANVSGPTVHSRPLMSPAQVRGSPQLATGHHRYAPAVAESRSEELVVVRPSPERQQQGVMAAAYMSNTERYTRQKAASSLSQLQLHEQGSAACFGPAARALERRRSRGWPP